MPSARLGLALATSAHQRTRLRVQVIEAGEGAPGQEVSFHPGEGSLDPSLSVGVVDPMGEELEAQAAREGGHLRGDHGIRPGAAGQDDAGVVDDAARRGAVHELRGAQQEVLGIEALEGRVVLDEQAPRIRQRQSRALRDEGLAGDFQPVRRGVVLHLLAGREVVLARALGRAAQLGLTHPARERAVGQPLVVLGGQDLAHAHGVALGPLVDRLEPLLRRLVQCRHPRGGHRGLAQDAPHRVT